MTADTAHHHQMVDGAPVSTNAMLSNDKTHLHFGKGQTETMLTLARLIAFRQQRAPDLWPLPI